jgi:hypothetical protein
MRIWLSAAAILLAGIVAGVLLAAGASADAWSTASELAACAPASAPKVVFPFSAPNARSGAGAIVWLGPAPGCSSATAVIDAAAIGDDDEPGAARVLARAAAGSLVAPLYALGTTAGEIVTVAGSSAASVLGAPAALLGEGSASGAAGKPAGLGGSDALVATMNGFIGDADVAAVAPAPGGGYEIVVRAQRHFAHALKGHRTLPIGRGAVSALAIGMDFRADRLLVWAQRGHLWAQYVNNRGRVKSRQLLGPAGYDPQISAVLSDDDRAFVIWTDEPAPGASGRTRVLLAHSAIGPRFHGARTVASFLEPSGVRLSPGCVAAERLSSEGVALLWPAIVGGHYVVQGAGVTQTGLLPVSTLSEPGEDVRLGAVATGPDSEIVVVVEVAPRTASGFESSQQELLATRSNLVHDSTGPGFGPLSELASAGANSDPSVGVDPANDAALVAWQSGTGAQARVEYSLGSGAS